MPTTQWFKFLLLLPYVRSQFNTSPFGIDQPIPNYISNDPGQTYASNNPYNVLINYQRPRVNNTYVVNSNSFLQDRLTCPQHWDQYQQSCYRFIKSPIRARREAKKICQAYESDLVSINSPEEHGFIIYQLLWRDPQHRKWYTGIVQQGHNYWVNEGDGTALYNMENAFLPGFETSYGIDFVAYSYSDELKRWGLETVRGDEQFLYICEVPLGRIHYLSIDDRTYQYGVKVDDPERVPRGPYFIRQPVDVVFDMSNRKTTNNVVLTCSAGGYPTPTYEWFKEEYENDLLISHGIDPLTDSRYTLSGGSLIINDPQSNEERGSYHCKASNEIGTILSESVSLSFGFIGEFNLKRSPESGNQNWGKAVYCDPPQHFPAVNYFWARDYFPNFVEEDMRVFVSYDGALYFSALQDIDRGNYSCTAQSKVSSTGKSGPFFQLSVHSNPNYQQLMFPNNFPKAFPEAPVAGRDVRLECMSFGYPVPKYNWTRRGSPLPRNAYTTSYNRVLVIPKASVDDEGEYVCRAYNERVSIKNSVTLSIQAEPNFTIPLVDKHVDLGSDLIWTCEAFGIPDVNYTWFKNGKPLNVHTIQLKDKERYIVQDNILTIKRLEPKADNGMYQCQARNALKTRYSAAQLRVLAFKPSFQKRPLETETYAAEQGNVTVVCNPEAAPRPTFIWKKDGNVIGSGGRRAILRNGNLIISPVSRDDEGLYTCTAANEYGMDESRGRLIVLRKPHMVRDLPSNIVTSIMQNFTLHCQATADNILDMAYVWTHNGIRIQDKDPNRMRLIPDGGTLHVINVTFAAAGEYECTVKSAVGKISSKTRVFVEGPPGPPGGVQATKITVSSATIHWTDGASNGRPILFYQIAARTSSNLAWKNVTERIVAQEIDRYHKRKEAILENALSPWSFYEFRVTAFNELGSGFPSAPSPQYVTPADKPYKAPSNVGGGGGKIGDLTITWTPLPPQDQNGPGIYYKVFWKKQGSLSEYYFLSLKEYGNIGVAVVNVDLENYYTKFDIKVQAINELGKGPESSVQTIYSAEDFPQVAPQQVIAHSFNSTALNVSWSAIDQRREIIRGKLIGHRLKYWKKGQEEEAAVYFLSRSTNPWALVVGLMPDTYYFVKVMAYNNAGEGPESERFMERTFRKAPQKPPTSVHVFGINPSTIRVVWRYISPSIEEEPIVGFKVRVWEVDQDISMANDTFVSIGSVLEAYVNDLTPGKKYHLRVLAFSSGGDGRMSSPAYTFQMGRPIPA